MAVDGGAGDSGVKTFDLAPTDGLNMALGLGAVSLVVAIVSAIAFGFGFLVFVAEPDPRSSTSYRALPRRSRCTRTA